MASLRRWRPGWFASIQTEGAVCDPVPAGRHHRGIDLGVARFATLSNGIVYEPKNNKRSGEGYGGELTQRRDVGTPYPASCRNASKSLPCPAANSANSTSLGSPSNAELANERNRL